MTIKDWLFSMPPSLPGPGIVGLLLIRGCPEDKLDAAFAPLSTTKLPSTASEILAGVDAAIAEVSS